jgi:DNA-binding protein HU-beta
MRKVDIVTKIADVTGVPKTDVLITLEAFFKEVKNQVKNGENVYVRGFGSFIAKKRAQKIGRIITRGESIVIPEHYIPAFKPAKVFMDQVKKHRKPGDEAPKEEPKP